MKPNAAEYVDQYAKAVFDFSSDHPGELTLTKGDIIKVISAVDDNWLSGTLRGKKGNFPLSFVEKVIIPGVQIGQKVFGATENFPALQDGDLEFRKGAIIVGSRKVDDNWWEGSYGGKHGIFPTTHVMELEVPSSLRERSKSIHSSEPMFARALCDAVAQLDDELSFKTGDMITVLEIIDADWYYGELGSKTGMFLSSCVDLLQDTTNLTADDEACDSAKTFSQTSSFVTNNNKLNCDNNICSSPSSSVGVSDDRQSQSSASESVGGSSIATSAANTGHSSNYSPQTLLSTSVISNNINKQNIPTDSIAQSSNVSTMSNSHRPYSEVLPYGKTLYPFVGKSADELTFRENEIVYLIQHVDDQWIEGELDGKTGLFPSAFVSIIVDCPYAVTKSSDADTTVSKDTLLAENLVNNVIQHPETVHKKSSDEKMNSNIDTGSEVYGLVKYTFVPEADGDLGLNEGDTVTILKQVDESWVLVQNDHGNQGMCPTNFIEIIGESPDEEPGDKRLLSSQTKEKNQTENVVSGQTLNKQSDKNLKAALEYQKSLNENIPKENLSVASKTRDMLPIKPKPILGPKPFLKPKPALLPKPALKSSEPMRAVHSSPGVQFYSEQSVPKSPSSASLDSFETRNVNETSFSKSSSSCELRSVGLHEETGQRTDNKSLENTSISNHLDSLITDKMNKAKQEADIRSRSPSTHSNVSSGSSGSLHKSSDSDSIVSLRDKRPPPPYLSSSNVNRHSVNFPVSFDNDHVSRIDGRCRSIVNNSPYKSTGVTLSSPTESGFSLGNSTFFFDAFSDQPTGRKAMPMRKPPPPPQRQVSVTTDVDIFDRKPSLRKPPPPRPALSSSKTERKNKKRLVPQRAAPGPPKTTKVPSRPAPPCPIKRPPPRAPPQVIIAEVREKIEANAEIINDLKNRIKEVETDLENCKKSKTQLEESVTGVEEESRDGVYDNIDFYNANIEGLTEELFNLRENLKEVCPEEIDAVTRQMEEEARKEEEEKQREEERKKNEEKKEKRRETREKVIAELITTETDYLQCLHLCMDVFLSPTADRHAEVDIEMMFGNMEEIADVSQRLLTAMEGTVNAKLFSEQCIGPCFVALAEDMKNVYAPYCRNHDDVITLIEKYQGNASVAEYFETMLNKVREKRVVFDLEALLIKPVQRIMKYPLLLNELIKTTEEDHSDKSELLNAINSMTDVATAINEYKRRKDLVYKYKKETDMTLGDKLAKLNLHSLKKKGSRFKGRLSTTIGLSPQTKDETFDKEATRFMHLEKIVKAFVRNVQVYMEQIQDSVRCHDSMVANMEDFCEDSSSSSLVQNFRQVHDLMEKNFLPEFEKSVSELVISPLSKLTVFFEAPNKVMQKRYDKLLDYDSMLRKFKDDRVTEKAMQSIRNDYEAMNAQLLDELPRLYSLSFQLLQDCIAAFLSAQQQYSESLLHRMSDILDISSLLSVDSGVVDVFNFKHAPTVDKMTMLSFIPKGFNPRMEPPKPDKKTKRQSIDVKALMEVAPADSGQSESQRMSLQQKYPADKLYRCNESYTSTDKMDLSLGSDVLVGVIMEKDPMGNQNKWFVDNGVEKGFVPKSVLVSCQPSSPKNLNPSMSTTGQFQLTNDLSVLQQTPIQQGPADDIDEFEFALEEDMSPEVTEEVIGSDSTGEFYYAEYEFESRAPIEVSLFEGQVVTVYAKHDQQGNKEWWYVDADGVKGYAPSGYLQPMS